MHRSLANSSRLDKLQAAAGLAAALLFIKVLVSILLEYRWYFPPDFDASAFLIGRRNSFVGTYRLAFYAHILSGPLTVMLAAGLMFSGGRVRWRAAHRWTGKLLLLIVLVVLVPSGLVMARQAFAGPIAGLGFASLAVVTGWCAAAAAYHARARRFIMHRRWAMRCFLLLASPLLLRVIAGAAIVTQLESDWFYRLNAWLSWLIPLAVYEIVWRTRARRKGPSMLEFRSSHQAEEALR